MSTDSSRPRRLFTLPELIAATVIAMLAAALFFPVLSTREYGCGRPTCIRNLKQLGLAMMMYVQDYDDHYPSYHPDAKLYWGAGDWGVNGQPAEHFHSSSLWIAQLLPYIKNPTVFYCPGDANPERNHASIAVPGSEAPFPVSYGPNLMFLNPGAYGRRNRPIAWADVVQPEKKCLLADCVTAYGFDMETIAYLRYSNYDPSLRQNGWLLDQFTGAGRVAWPDRLVEGLTRHQFGSNIAFADGHVRWLRHDRIPNNDERDGKQYRALVLAMAPWK